MTLEQFLERFAAEAPKHRWHLEDGSRIRSACGCPIETVAGTGSGHIARASKHLLLEGDAPARVIDAADATGQPWRIPLKDRAVLRRRLLECCGLEERR